MLQKGKEIGAARYCELGIWNCEICLRRIRLAMARSSRCIVDLFFGSATRYPMDKAKPWAYKTGPLGAHSA